MNEETDWSEIAKADDFPDHLKEVVRVMMEHDNIDPLVFMAHLDVPRGSGRHFLYEDKEIITPTFLGYINLEWGKGPAFPKWFCCAYPDVTKWASNPDSKVDQRLDNLSLSDSDLNSRGHLKLHLLRDIVDIYLDVVDSNLECSLSQSEAAKKETSIDSNPKVEDYNNETLKSENSPQSFDESAITYAGFWKRVVASLIDIFIVFIPTTLIISPLISSIPPEQVQGIINTIGFMVGWLYFASMESSEQQATLGKSILGIKVTDSKGEKVGFGRATGRHFGKILSGIILMIGYIMAAFTNKKQALHDKISGCLVINSNS